MTVRNAKVTSVVRNRSVQYRSELDRRSKGHRPVIPEFNGKLIGAAQRVLTATGSPTILIAVVKGKDITVEGINTAMKLLLTVKLSVTQKTKSFLLTSLA